MANLCQEGRKMSRQEERTLQIEMGMINTNGAQAGYNFSPKQLQSGRAFTQQEYWA
jgi:hypothetical protein